MRFRPKNLVPAAVFILLFPPQKDFAQLDSIPGLKIAVLAPLYIDSAFNEDNTYKLGNISIPKYLLPGLDFYNGVMMAIDSLEKEKTNIEVWVYDTKKKFKTSEMLIKEIQNENFMLIIASFTNIAEQKAVADFAFNNNIPLISATYPNDAFISTNPFFVMINSTLKTHINGLYSYVQRNYPAGKTLFVTRKGLIEEKIQSEFDSVSKKTSPPLKYQTLLFSDNFNEYSLLPFMDSTKQNIIICGSLNENFGLNLVKILSAAPSYRSVAIGMPTWDGVKELSGEECKNVEIVFSTPYNFNNSDKAVLNLASSYKLKFNGRASDMVFKGFESMYHFSKLLAAYPVNFINNISDTSFKVFNYFNFQPVRLNSSSYIPDYIENKKLYFIKKFNGEIKSIN